MNESELTKEQLVEILDKYLLNLAYGDIEKTLSLAGTNLAVFILGACFIDAMAGFRFGITKKDIKKGGVSSRHFQDFTKEYLPAYSAKDLWKSLRCGLVHTYTEYGKYAFVNNKSYAHHEPTPKGKTIVDNESFYIELGKAYQKLKDDILTKDEVFNNAKRRLALGIMKIDLINKS